MATRHRISDHFVVEEFDCHNGERVPGFAWPALVVWARVWGEPLRERFGPVHVLSGFRPEAYNRSIGGAKASYHVYNAVIGGGKYRASTGVAVDVQCSKGTPADWLKWALARAPQLPVEPRGSRGGVGGYPSFVHLDTGPRRTWFG